ncbi:Uncharacterised protein [Mycobacteroides abscessus]|nr:Uncharacterised protein [Mycobacteroides abscessus]
MPANAGACAFHVEIWPLRDWRVAVVVCRACPIAWNTVSVSRPSSVPMPAAADGPRCATWSILCRCRLIARTRATWTS